MRTVFAITLLLCIAFIATASVVDTDSEYDNRYVKPIITSDMETVASTSSSSFPRSSSSRLSAATIASSSKSGRVRVKNNDAAAAAAGKAAAALNRAADAHKALQAHHQNLKETKSVLKKLQQKTASLTDAANAAMKAASIAQVPAAETVNQIVPVNDDGEPRVGAGSPCTPAGASWVNQFPTSRSVSDLTPAFGAKVQKFISALQAAGASVSIAATYRPVERAFLMHYSYRVAKGQIAPTAVPVRAGINICWNRAGAQAMVNGYGIVYAPALASQHTARQAIDMNISWSKTITIGGVSVPPGNGATSSALRRAGATFGVIKLVSDPPHWSVDGH